MRNMTLPYALVLSVLVSGCVITTSSKPSPMQFRHVSTRPIQGRYGNIFRATMTVLQDNGYIIKQTDMSSGLITAEVNRETPRILQALQSSSKKRKITHKGTLVQASAVVDKLNERNTEVRITIQERTYSETGSTTRVRQLRDPRVYKKILDDITLEVKRREAIGR